MTPLPLLCLAYQTTKQTDLPINVPKSASVELDFVAPGKDIVKVLDQLVPGAVDEKGMISINSNFGAIKMSKQDLGSLLSRIHQVHFETYKTQPGDDALARHERDFTHEGLRRGTMLRTGDGVLVMQKSNPNSQLALVRMQKQSVTVLRIDGIPENDKLIEFALKTIVESVSKPKHN